MEEKQAEGIWVTCPRCKGTGKEKETHLAGLFRTEEVEIICSQCKGTKKIFHIFSCPHMSIGRIYLNGSWHLEGYATTDCIGKSCAFWDHDHGGGCLERKALLKNLYGEEK